MTSGFKLIPTGEEAFSARVGMIRESKETLCLQYYMVHYDLTGKTIINELLHAADRGVKIKLLLDNLYIGDISETLNILNAHENIEVRNFNPSTRPHRFIFVKLLIWIFSLKRYSRRMHNKAIVADDKLALVGGRNLGDEYFGFYSNFTFSDMDVYCHGSIAKQIRQSFDAYWENENTAQFADLPEPRRAEKIIRKLRVTLYHFQKRVAFMEAISPSNNTAHTKFALTDANLCEGRGYFCADDPNKITIPLDQVKSAPMEALNGLLEDAKEELIIVTPYCIPQEKGMAHIKALIERGLKVKILTNSLSSTDVSVVHACYSRYRKALLEAGVEIYELKSIPGKRTRQNLFRRAERSSLHAKAYVVDRKYALLGSCNFDPRSRNLNTETGLVVECDEMVKELLEMFDEITQPEAAYKLRLDTKGRLRWQTKHKKKMKTYRSDPKPGPLRRIAAFLFYYFAPEDQL